MKPPKVERPRLAVVRWRDTHAHDGGWQTVSEVAGTSSERMAAFPLVKRLEGLRS